MPPSVGAAGFTGEHGVFRVCYAQGGNVNIVFRAAGGIRRAGSQPAFVRAMSRETARRYFLR